MTEIYLPITDDHLERIERAVFIHWTTRHGRAVALADAIANGHPKPTPMDETDTTRCKIDRITERRALSDLDDALRRRHEAGASLRDLESFFNRQLLKSELRARHVGTLHGEVENTYRLLTHDDIGAGARTEARARLERRGIDVDELLEDFVSYQTIRTHLRECAGRDTARESTIDRTNAEGTIFSMLARSEAVIDQTLERLRSVEEIRTGPLDLTVSARVACQDCGREYSIPQLLDRGQCDCDAPIEPGND